MTIPEETWIRYKNALAKADKKAAEEMAEYVRSLGGFAGHEEEAIEYAFALATKYGEAAAALACEMYDAVAELSGEHLPPAVPAETASYGEVARTMRGVGKDSGDPDSFGNATGRLVKQAGADTTLRNALRDGAEFAWVPSGDTCAFCIMLASNGWQRASKKAIKGGHAEHIHTNCDCTYAIRFDGKGGVAGYDPEKYRAMYDAAEGDSWQEKVNSMRRAQYAEHREEINAQKRAAYAERVEAEEQSRIHSHNLNSVQIQALDAPGYREKFNGISGDSEVDETIYQCAVRILEHRNGTNLEDLYLVDADTGRIIYSITESKKPFGVQYHEQSREAIAKARAEGRSIIAIHNHPNGLPPSLDDGSSAYTHGYSQGVVVGHNLEVWTYGRTGKELSPDACEELHRRLSERLGLDVDFEADLWYEYCKQFGMEVSER